MNFKALHYNKFKMVLTELEESYPNHLLQSGGVEFQNILQEFIYLMESL